MTPKTGDGSAHVAESGAPGVRRARGAGGGVGAFVVVAYLLAVGVVGGMLAASFDAFGTLDASLATELRLGGIIGGVLILTLAPVAVVLLVRSRPGPSDSGLQEVIGAVRSLQEQAALSDDARRVLNRRGERDLLCRTIEADIQASDWDAGIVLCKELADRFGYRAEAEEYRSRIERARSQMVEQRVNDSMAHLDGLIVQRQWDAALLESARIRRLYPDSPRTENLRRRVEQASRVYKADLERRFLDCAHQDQIEDAMELLRELDAYLTEAEAEPYREVARGVIGKARNNVGAQFKIAVHDRRWGDAATIGRRIIAEFPNTRMAHEVRQVLDGILQRANAGPVEAGVSGGGGLGGGDSGVGGGGV